MFQLTATKGEDPTLELLAAFETQRRICSQYVHIASHQLFQQEARVISQANDLLEQLAGRPAVKDLSEWDIFSSTRDSMVLEDETSFNLSLGSLTSRSKIIQRKTARPALRSRRDADSSGADWMSEVEEQCSTRTSQGVRRLAEECRRLKLRIYEHEKKQKTWKAREKLLQELQESSATQARRIAELEITINKLRTDNNTLKSQNYELEERLHRRHAQINSEKKIRLFEEIICYQGSATGAAPSSALTPRQRTAKASDCLQVVEELLEQRQKILNLRYESVKRLEQKLEAALFGQEGRCEDCCQMLRRLKGSVLSYRTYLQRAGDQFDRLVDSFRGQVTQFDCSQ